MDAELTFISTFLAAAEAPQNPPFLVLFFGLTGLCAVISGGLLLFVPSKHLMGWRIALTGFFFAILPAYTAVYLYSQGFVPESMIAKGATKPQWPGLMVPLLPLILNGLLLIAHRKEMKAQATKS
ncbi:MAG: hypothetical protein NTV80_22835 [Verrucomicrobia bacterium]|nr:hypothetical protein [Verrucomicrobiota bacterium]